MQYGSTFIYTFWKQTRGSFFWKSRGTAKDELSEKLSKAKSRYTKVLEDQSTCALPIHIISSEDISNFSVTEFSRLKRFFEPYYTIIKVIQFVRNPFTYLDSAFQEKLKTGYDQFILDKFIPHYKDRINALESAFGKLNVSILEYNSEKSSLDALIMHMQGLFPKVLANKVASSENIAIKNKPDNANTRLTATAMKILFGYNQFNNASIQQLPPVVTLHLAQKLSTLKGAPATISSSQKIHSITKIKEQLSWLKENYKISFEFLNVKAETPEYLSSANIHIIDPEMITWLNDYLLTCGHSSQAYEPNSPLVSERYFELLLDALLKKFT